jgi:hypothetical protein
VRSRDLDGDTRPVPAATPAPSQAEAADPREGLRAGWMDAEEASWNMSLLATRPRPDGFYRADDIGDMALANSDLAFQENLVIVGNFHGFNVYDVSDPASPTLRTSVVCPGGQGDVSVYGNLVFFSAQETRGRIDCGPEGAAGQVNEERFRGVRIFDISNLDAPRQVPRCRPAAARTPTPWSRTRTTPPSSTSTTRARARYVPPPRWRGAPACRPRRTPRPRSSRSR